MNLVLYSAQTFHFWTMSKTNAHTHTLEPKPKLAQTKTLFKNSTPKECAWSIHRTFAQLLIDLNAKTVKWQPQVHLTTLVIVLLSYQSCFPFLCVCFHILWRVTQTERKKNSDRKKENNKRTLIIARWTKDKLDGKTAVDVRLAS